MDDETSFTIDRTTIDSLSSESRVLMLSSIRNRKKTNAELGKELSLKPSTIHHHLERLKEAGLVESPKTATNGSITISLHWGELCSILTKR